MYNTWKEIDIEYLKKNNQKIHYFGLGFIQLKINNEYRLHFYNSKLPKIIGDEEVHNHRYSFVSKILKGSFTQELFVLEKGIEYVLENESCKVGVTAPKLGEETYSVKKIGEQVFSEGSHYFMEKDTYHKVDASFAITLLKRENPSKEFAQVVRKIGAPSVCPFSKVVPEEELWEIIGEMLK